MDRQQDIEPSNSFKSAFYKTKKTTTQDFLKISNPNKNPSRQGFGGILLFYRSEDRGNVEPNMG